MNPLFAPCFWKQAPTEATVFKVRITSGGYPWWQGWVVWLLETYRGLYVARLPSGSVVYVQHLHIQWSPVPAETPLTTRASLQAEAIYRRDWYQGWSLGDTIRTEGTNLRWRCLSEWFIGWHRLQQRRHSASLCHTHLRQLPPAMVAQENQPEYLYALADCVTQMPLRWVTSKQREYLWIAVREQLTSLQQLSYEQRCVRQNLSLQQVTDR